MNFYPYKSSNWIHQTKSESNIHRSFFPRLDANITCQIEMLLFFRFHKIYTSGESLEKTIQDKDEVYVYETDHIKDNKQVEYKRIS